MFPQDGYHYSRRLSKGEFKVVDAVYGIIYLPPIVRDFIDTPHFQRLRKIKQLGLINLVHPSAKHSRFEHALGTAHLANLFIHLLIENNPSAY